MSEKKSKTRVIRELARGFLVTTLAAGCADFGAGATGEFTAPARDRYLVDTLDLQEAATPTTEPSSTQPATRPTRVALALGEARRRALARNLDLAVARLDPATRREELSQAEAQFEALLTADASYANLDQPTATQLEGSRFEAFSVTPGLTFPLYTGGFLRLLAPLDRTETNNEFSTLNPAYEADGTAQLSIPLLRGFGVAANAERIRVAYYELQRGQARAKLEATRLLAEVERAYWSLAAARDQVRVREQQRELARRQLDRARRLFAAGTAAQVEILRAESALSDTAETLLLAENNVRLQQRELKRLLNDPDLPLTGDTEVVTQDLPAPTPYKLDETALVAAALEHRPELLDAELAIAQTEANVSAARNALLPLVTLDYRFNANGLGDSLRDATRQTGDFDYLDHTVGLRVEVPLGNRAARNAYRAALLRRLSILTDKDARELSVRQEVLDAIDQLRVNLRRIEANRLRVDLNARLVQAEERQFEQGLRTGTDVFIAQTTLAQAQAELVSALADYQVATADLAFATGLTLGQSGVDWRETSPDKP